MARRLIPSLLLLLAACSGNNPSPAPEPPVGQWQTLFSVGATNPIPGDGGWYVDVPAARTAADAGPTCKSDPTCPHLNMIVFGPGRPISSVITLKGQMTATGTLNYNLDGKETCPTPAQISLYFQRAGDNYSAADTYEFYRYWAAMILPLNQSFTLAMPLTAHGTWFSVYGKPVSANPAAFAAAIANPVAVGMTFGGGCTGHHGINVSGTARFTLEDYTVQ
jgi:hypothetical protein